MILQLTPRIKGLLCLAGVLLGLRLLVMPLYAWQSQTKVEIRQLKENIARLARLDLHRTEFETSLRDAENSLAALRQYFNEDIVGPEALQLKVQKDLEELARKSGLTLRSSEWGYVNEDQFLIQTPLKLSFQSPPSRLYDFLGQVESLPQIFTVDALQIMKGNDETLSSTIEISGYSLKNAESNEQGKTTP